MGNEIHLTGWLSSLELAELDKIKRYFTHDDKLFQLQLSYSSNWFRQANKSSVYVIAQKKFNTKHKVDVKSKSVILLVSFVTQRQVTNSSTEGDKGLLNDFPNHLGELRQVLH